MHSQILGPVVALVAWTLVMQIWMYATRLPAMSRAGIKLDGLVGGRGANLEGVIPDSVQWKSHNYAHLLEQPTLFYAVALCLALFDPRLDVVAVTAVAGNVSAELATRNVQTIVEQLDPPRWPRIDSCHTGRCLREARLRPPDAEDRGAVGGVSEGSDPSTGPRSSEPAWVTRRA